MNTITTVLIAAVVYTIVYWSLIWLVDSISTIQTVGVGLLSFFLSYHITCRLRERKKDD